MPGWTREGDSLLHELGGRLDALHAVTGTPLTARRTWLQAWVESFPDWQPWAVGLDGDDGSLRGVALFATKRVGPVDRVVMLGHGPSDLLCLPARGEAEALELGEAVAACLRARRRPWHLYARHLRATDGAVQAVAAHARGRLVPGDTSPVLRIQSGARLDSYVTGDHRRGISRLHNRLAREGRRIETTHLHTVDEISQVWGELERIFRARDRELDRTSAMDKPRSRAFFRAVVVRHAEAGQVRLTCVHIDGRLAAYVLCFLDGDVVRMWNCRFDPELGRYSPGKIAMEASVRHALEEGALAYDFMRGEERYKDGYANHREVAVDLSASSHGGIRAAETLVLRAHARLRAVEDSGGRAAELAGRARGVIERATD